LGVRPDDPPAAAAAGDAQIVVDGSQLALGARTSGWSSV
jgi:hypothetical protein